MKKILRTLLAGVTGRAQWALDLATPENGFEIVGLCDNNADSLESVREKLGLGEKSVDQDLESLLNRMDADALIICTPTRFHVPFSILGLKKGLAVLTEKGMAPDWKEASRLAAFAADCNGVLCVAQNYRYSSINQTIKQCLEGKVPDYQPGPVFLGDLLEHRTRPEPRTLNYPFASVWDMSCHHFDNLLFWLGPPSAMTAQAFGAPWSAYEHPNNTSAHIEFESGARVNYFHGHDCARGHLFVSFHGQNGALMAKGAKLEFSPRPPEQLGHRPVVQVPLPELPPTEVGVLTDFYRYVVDGLEPGISVRNNLEVMAMCEMLVRSVQEERRVLRAELDPS